MKFVIALFLFCSAVAGAQPYWSYSGPEGGVIKSMFVRTDGVLYAGTQRGVYLSDNLGQNWTKGSNNIYQSGINSMVIASGYVFAAADNSGFYISADNGYNFTLVSSAYSINAMCKINETIYAGLGGNLSTSGIVYTINNGVNWSQTNFPGSIRVNDIITDDIALYAATDNGIYVSYHIGSTWNKYDSGLPFNTKVFSLKKAGYIILAGTDRGVYRSADAGVTWSAVNSGLPAQYPFIAVTIQGTRAIASCFGKGVYVSQNYGDNWVEVNNGLNDRLIYKFGVYNSYLFAASTGGGVYLSVDFGTNWFQKNTGLDVHTINALYSKDNILYAGTQGGGVYRSVNSGSNWSVSNVSLANTVVYSFTEAGNYIFTGTYGGIFRSSNGGSAWEPANSGLNDSVTLSLGYNGSSLFAGTQSGGIYRSTNFGTNWTKLNGIILNDTVYALANMGNVMFASSKRNGFVKSSDNGSSWQTINNGFTYPPFSLSLSVRGSDIFAALFFGTPQRGIFKSPDSGSNWSWISSPVSDASYYVQTYMNIVFASYLSYTGGIIRMSTNDGASWSLVTPQPPQWKDNCDVLTIKVFNNYLFAGTSGKSLWRIPLSQIISVRNISEQIPAEFYLYQNYPNPFNPSTAIRYSIPRPGEVKLTVFDAAGREAVTLVNEKQSAGTYEVIFDGKIHPSGVYFYRLTAGDFSQTKKLILIK